MAAHRKLDDETLREYVKLGFDGQYIATATGLSKQGVCQRIRALEKAAAIRLPTVVSRTDASLWNIKEALEGVYNRLLKLLEEEEEPPVPVLRETRATIETAMRVLEVLYTVQAQKEFEDAVLYAIGECDPNLRSKVLDHLRSQREIRAAFIPR